MDQLSLFPGVAARADTAAVELPSADETLAEPDRGPGVGSSSQIGLFDARVRELRAIREAIASGAIDEARHRLQSVDPDTDFDVDGTRERLSTDNLTSARRHYRDALLIDPFDGAFENVLDDDVRSLADVAESDVEVEGEPHAWAAAVGIVAGVQALPSPSDFPLSEPNQSPGAALGRARQFIEALVLTTAPQGRHDPSALIEARRTMKRASPALFAWYMARLAGPLRSPSFARQPSSARDG
jgi:hypothetical protein